MSGLKVKDEKYKESMEVSELEDKWKMCKGKDEVNRMNKLIQIKTIY